MTQMKPSEPVPKFDRLGKIARRRHQHLQASRAHRISLRAVVQRSTTTAATMVANTSSFLILCCQSPREGHRRTPLAQSPRNHRPAKTPSSKPSLQPNSAAVLDKREPTKARVSQETQPLPTRKSQSSFHCSKKTAIFRDSPSTRSQLTNPAPTPSTANSQTSTRTSPQLHYAKFPNKQ
jgi:hypothetical protein